MPPSAAPTICTGARCVRAERLEVWRLVVIDRGRRKVTTARALANATGAWTASVAETVLRVPPPRLAVPIRISQIIVRRLFDNDNVYVFQNSDGRLVFASPYERDFTLIGYRRRAFKGDPAAVSMPAADIAISAKATNRYFRAAGRPLRRASWTVLRPIWPLVRRAARRARWRDVSSMRRAGQAPLLTVCGGDVTTLAAARRNGRSRG